MTERQANITSVTHFSKDIFYKHSIRSKIFAITKKVVTKKCVIENNTKTIMTTREEILQLVRKYYEENFAHKKAYEEGDRIAYGGRKFDDEELVNLVDSALDFWLTT